MGREWKLEDESWQWDHEVETAAGRYQPSSRISSKGELSFPWNLLQSWQEDSVQLVMKLTMNRILSFPIHWFPGTGERILKVTKKSGNRGRCRKLSLWNWFLVRQLCRNGPVIWKLLNQPSFHSSGSWFYFQMIMAKEMVNNSII